MKASVDYTLCLVTDRRLMSTATVEESVSAAVQGGCTLVQLREKGISSRHFYDTAVKVRKVTAPQGVPLIINDRVDIALAAEANGVHIGQDDLPAAAVRRAIGSGMIMGVSVSSLAEAQAAVDSGADYIGVGAMYPTATKPDAGLVTFEELRRIREKVSLPIVVIGGIGRGTVLNFRNTGVNGVAAVSAIIAQADIAGAAREIKSLFLGGLPGGKAGKKT